MDIITGINLATLSILALLILSMTFEYAQIRLYAIFAAGMITAPFILALTGNLAGWFSVNYLEVAMLERGVFSIVVATGLGLALGLILNIIKKVIIDAFRNRRRQPVPETDIES